MLNFGAKMGAEGLGLIGFVFPESEGVVHFHNPLLKQSLRSFEHPVNWVCIGFVLGLNWVCFHQVSNWICFHNPLLNKSLSSFGFFGNWVCFAYIRRSWLVTRGS